MIPADVLGPTTLFFSFFFERYLRGCLCQKVEATYVKKRRNNSDVEPDATTKMMFLYRMSEFRARPGSIKSYSLRV